MTARYFSASIFMLFGYIALASSSYAQTQDGARADGKAFVGRR